MNSGRIEPEADREQHQPGDEDQRCRPQGAAQPGLARRELGGGARPEDGEGDRSGHRVRVLVQGDGQERRGERVEDPSPVFEVSLVASAGRRMSAAAEGLVSLLTATG